MSKIITPPDKIYSDNSFLVINAVDTYIDLLVLWLKLIPHKYDIHLWHLNMENTNNWLWESVCRTKCILVNNEFKDNLQPAIINLINSQDHVHYFGINTDYKDLVKFFIEYNFKNY